MSTYPIYAIYAARGIKLTEAEKRMEQAPASRKRNLLIYELGKDQLVFMYSFGSVVFANVDLKNAYKILRKINKALIEPLEDDLMEEYAWTTEGVTSEEVDFNVLKLKEATPDKISIASYVLAQSVAIDYFDNLAESIISTFDKLNSELEHKGSLRTSSKKILKSVGAGNSILQSTITRLALLDKPDVVWEHADLESIYQNMRAMFELDDRFKNIEYKIQYIQNSSEIFLSLLRDRRSQALEIIIIFLIALEILLFLPDILK